MYTCAKWCFIGSVLCAIAQWSTGRGSSRALRDGNWRSPTTPDDEPAPGWGNQRQPPPPSPGTCAGSSPAPEADHFFFENHWLLWYIYVHVYEFSSCACCTVPFPRLYTRATNNTNTRGKKYNIYMYIHVCCIDRYCLVVCVSLTFT